ELRRPRVRADAVLGRKGLRDLVVVGRVAGAGPARLLFVAFDEPVRVEVVFNDGEAGLARGADRGHYVRGLGLRARPAPDHVVEAGEQRLVEAGPARLEALDPSADVLLVPRDLRPAREHVVDADLLEPPHSGLVEVGRDAEADLRRVRAFGRHARERRPALGGRATWPRAPEGRGSHSPANVAAPAP